LEVFKRERTIKKLSPKIETLRSLLKPLSAHPHVGDIRQIGLIAGIELVRNRVAKEPYPLTDRMGVRVTDGARNAGLLLRPLGNIIVLMPPLSTTINELRLMVHILTEAIDSATRGPLGLPAENRHHDRKGHK
jgi:adenosylmethionine-8-amino-7-oxononanoate aminotransferase